MTTTEENEDYLAAASKAVSRAMKSYEANDETWRRDVMLFSALMMGQTLLARAENRRLELQPDDSLFKFFGLLVAAFSDAGRGSRHPLFELAKVKGRPRANNRQTSRLLALATLAMVEINLAKRNNLRGVNNFQTVSRNLRKMGITVDWRQVRSAWNNRLRNREVMAMLSDHEQTLQEKKYSDQAVAIHYQVQSKALN